MATSKWDQLQMGSKIIQILSDAQSHNIGHHFGKPFMTSYQIAIEFRQRFPKDFQTIGKEIGGKGIGQHNSLAQYIARELSNRIKNGKIQNIEGRFLWRKHLHTIQYDSGNIESSSMQAFDLSIFRIADK